MARPRLMSRLKHLWFARRKRRVAGFTLIELLISMIIGAIITAALLSLVVDLTETNQRDLARSETQRDMQLAMNYIVQDLREAVYVYDGDCLEGSGTTANFNTFCPGIIRHIAPIMTASTGGVRYIPVLAFWRADELPQVLVSKCETQARTLNQADFATWLSTSGVPCVSGRSYTLVVYGLADVTGTTPVAPWQGKARIVRYELSQYSANVDPNNPVVNTGWVDPLPDPNSNFQQWPYRSNNGVVTLAQTTIPNNQPDVLTDFADDSTATPACPTPSRITPNNAVASNPNNVRSFYACVRGNTLDARVNGLAAELGINQEVQVVLAGNAAGRSGIPFNSTNVASLAPLQTRVLSRGIVYKNPK